MGLTREGTVLLSVSILLMLLLSAFTLAAYGRAVERMVAQQQSRAAKVARDAALALADLASPAASDFALAEGDLRRAVPGALGVAVLDPDGGELVRVGDLPALDAWLLPRAAGADPLALGPAVFGPDASLPDRVVAVTGLSALSGRRALRVDLPAPGLIAERRRLRVLQVLVLGVDSAVLVLVVFYLRYLFSPYEKLLAQARTARGEQPGSSDEVAFLLSTFEQALEALAERPAAGGDAELASLERTLSAGLASGLLLLDRRGRLLAINRLGSELLRLESPELGAPVEEVLAAHPELAERLRGTGARDRELRREVYRVGEATLGLTAHPLRREDGELRGTLVLFADLTEVHRRERESRLTEGLAQLGAMAAGAAHELRNSLATLQGYLSLLAAGPEPAVEAEYLAEVRHESEHLERVLDDFLAFARPETARPEDVDLAALIRQLLRDPLLVEAGVECSLAESDSPWWLRGDPQLLERAIKNLLLNAVQAGGGSPVRVSLTREGDELVVEISDRGPGLPPEVRERLFTPFVSGRAGGVGLGLPLAHRIATLHGGSLDLVDRPQGGTRARFRLPATPGEAPPDSPSGAGSAVA